jgi:phosphoribosylanthranilate isomerase
LDVPFFLSGGLSMDNLEEVKVIKHPQFYGVDLNSRFEIEPGLKDVDKLKNAFELLR